MPYIGSSASPLPVNFAAVQAQSFDGTGSQTAFTLSRTVPSAASIEVLVNNVQQSPYDASYSVSGTTLTFSEAPSSGTNNVYVVYRDQSLGSLVDESAYRKAEVDTLLAAKQAADAELTTLAGASADRATFLASEQAFSMRNRIINGDMRIDQRNAGTSVTSGYAVDRFLAFNITGGAFSAQRDTVAPAGFTNSYKWTTTTADATMDATDRCGVVQVIEGFNIADLGWGTASAQPITVSFWVRSSLTGTFGASIRNGGASRSYPFTYTISAANTWEYKTVTIPGDTSGTWATDNSAGLQLAFSMGAGADFRGTAGSWQAGNLQNVAGTVAVVSTLNATWQITGVQLEAGSVATPFERRPYGTELQLCCRYFARTFGYSGLTGTGSELSGVVYGSVQMRATPTLTSAIQEGGPTALSGLVQPNNNSNMLCQWWVASGSKGSPGYIIWNGTASAEL